MYVTSHTALRQSVMMTSPPAALRHSQPFGVSGGGPATCRRRVQLTVPTLVTGAGASVNTWTALTGVFRGRESRGETAGVEAVWNVIAMRNVVLFAV